MREALSNPIRVQVLHVKTLVAHGKAAGITRSGQVAGLST